ncbi:hypothetical protein [Streptomyces sp. NPDC006879]|uniref:hypothetical protein n=1 Tax=Streptomyces sp. NPDC006879 TaxID=3364767 RepID=UPI0036BE246A
MRTRLISFLSGLLLALFGAALWAAPGAQAATGPTAVAEALKAGPVYVDPQVEAQLPPAEAEALAQKIKSANKPVFVAVLPATADYPAQSILPTVRTETGIAGLYGIRLGDGFNAGADPSVMSQQAVRNLTDAVKIGDPDAVTELNNFVDQALPQVKGSAPASWGGSSATSNGVATLVVLGAVLALGVAGAYTLTLRTRRVRAQREREAVEKLRVVVDEDITAFGEEMDRLDFHPGETGADDAMRGDFERSLDAYDRAKAVMGSVRHPDEVRGATQALEDGRFALASLAARREGSALPERRLPCFFDPRHGPSTEDANWAPAAGVTRLVPVCAADAVRLREGAEPMARMVQTDRGPRPYYEAGPAYGPWAGGYFGGGVLPGLLMGTMLGSMMSTSAYAADYGGFEGGDYSGADFDSSGFDGGGFGGGDFGGGF